MQPDAGMAQPAAAPAAVEREQLSSYEGSQQLRETSSSTRTGPERSHFIIAEELKLEHPPIWKGAQGMVRGAGEGGIDYWAERC